MKWLIVQSDGEHKGQDGWEPNWMMRECYAIQHALRSLGHAADVWGLRHANYSQTPDYNSYDVVFTCEQYEFSWLPNVHDYSKPLRVYWIIDAHWQPLANYAQAFSGYSIILHSTRKFIEPYQNFYPQARQLYFPNGVDDRFFDQALHTDQPHRKPLIFIGSRGTASRAAALDHMTCEAGLEHGYGITGMRYVEAVLNAKVQFNKGLNGDINYRNWETTGLGTCLLTEYDPEMEKLGFRHADNCLFYHNCDEAVKMALSAVDSGMWLSVAQSGYQLSRQHTYTQRIKNLLSELSA